MKKGFTLIELLVVIAIIGILSAVVLAALNSSRDKAKQSSLRSYMGQLATAIELYRDSNGGSVDQNISYSDTDAGFQNMVSPYITIQDLSSYSFLENTNIIYYAYPDLATTYSCGVEGNDEDYFLYVYSEDDDLNLPHLLEDGVGQLFDGLYYYYCTGPFIR